jgi:hypothetical protein
MITLGPSLTGLRGTQVTGSIIYTLVTCKQMVHVLCSYLFVHYIMRVHVKLLLVFIYHVI